MDANCGDVLPAADVDIIFPSQMVYVLSGAANSGIAEEAAAVANHCEASLLLLVLQPS